MAASSQSAGAKTGNAKTLAEYILQAEIVVAAKNAPRFERLVLEFFDRKGFTRLHPEFDARLLLGLRTIDPFPFGGNDASLRPNARMRIDNRMRDDRLAHRYVHVFHLPDLQDLDLAQIMVCCADDPLYNEINAQVVQEVQNFRTRVKFPVAVSPAAPGKQYYHVERQFQVKNLGAYLFGLGACFPALERHGWKNLGLHQAITGELNTVAEFWELPAEESERDVLEVLAAKEPHLFRVMVEPYPAQAQSGEVMVPTPYAPGMPRTTLIPPPGQVQKAGQLSELEAAS
jgi:hypothetical protein